MCFYGCARVSVYVWVKVVGLCLFVCGVFGFVCVLVFVGKSLVYLCLFGL